jgi:hypothetical protein
LTRDPAKAAGGRPLERLLADPPPVHPKFGEPRSAEGLTTFGTDPECYSLIQDHLFDGARTLETGLGLSTALFALSGAFHTCLVPYPPEVERLKAYCAERSIPLERTTFHVGWSDEVLPTLVLDTLDVVFIDGGHGFPTPMIDWYFAGQHLRKEGLLVLDDLQLEPPRMLSQFLTRDPRWRELARTPKWAAYLRLSEGPLRDEWTDQPFLRDAIPFRRRVKQALRALGRR